MPTTDFNKVTIRAQYKGFAGTVINGPVTFTPDIAWANDPESTTGIIILSEPIVGQVVNGELLNSSGSGPCELYATDDPDITPLRWTYSVHEKFADVVNRPTYHISVPIAAAGTGIDLTTLPHDMPAAAPDFQWVLVKQGVVDGGSIELVFGPMNGTLTPVTASFTGTV